MSWLIDWKVKLIAISCVLAAFFFWHKVQVSSAVEIALVKQETAFQQQLQEANRKAELAVNTAAISIRDSADKAEKEKQSEIASINSKYNAIIAGLRERITRKEGSTNTGNTNNAQATARCTGKELYREDAEFLIGEAASADKLRVALKACYGQYDNVKSNLDNLRMDRTLGSK